jgi:HSP20 family protein
MTLVRFSPMRELATLQSEMDRLFDSLSVRPDRGLWRDGSFFPPVDVSESEEEYVVRAEIPGMRQEEIKVNMVDNVLTLKGEKKFEKDEKKANYHHQERVYGYFERSFTLGTPIQADRIKARYQNGVLEVHLPKSEAVKLKEIRIE